MQKRKKNKIFLFGIFILIVGIMIGIIPTFLKMEKERKDSEKVEDYLEQTKKNQEEIDEPNRDDRREEETEEESYLLVLEIPKIGLKRGVYPKTSSLNSVEYNVMIMEESTLPDSKAHHLVLAAHNGNADIAYFNKLNRLQIGDSASIYYEGKKYTYLLSDTYEVDKDGTVEVKRDKNKETLTLITCKHGMNFQEVYIFYLKSVESY